MKTAVTLWYLITGLVLLAPVVQGDEAAGAKAGKCERGSIGAARQSDLLGTWKETGFYEDGKIEPLGFKMELTHEFRDDCTMIATLDGDASTYQYLIEDGKLVLVSKLIGRTVKEFRRVSKDTLIHGSDVFSRVK